MALAVTPAASRKTVDLAGDEKEFDAVDACNFFWATARGGICDR